MCNAICTDISEIRKKMLEPISDDNTIFCAGTIINGHNLLVVDYYPEYDKQPNWFQIKFAGGKSKSNGIRKDITPEDTLKAELNEEVFIKGSKGIISYSPFYSIHLNGSNTRPAHTKLFSLIDDYSGMFRKKTLFEGEEFGEKWKKTDEMIKAPRWEKVSVLVNTLFRGHKSAFMALCEYMAPKNEEFMWAHMYLQRQKDEGEF